VEPHKSPLQAWSITKEWARHAGIEQEAAPYFTWLKAMAHPQNDRLESLVPVDIDTEQQERRAEMMAALLPACSATAQGTALVVNAALAPADSPAQAAPPPSTRAARLGRDA